MGFGTEQLRDKALLALEEAVEESLWRPVRRTLALRFAFAYLWALKPVDRSTYDDLWKDLVTPNNPPRFGSVNAGLNRIYLLHGVERCHAIGLNMRSRIRKEVEGQEGLPPSMPDQSRSGAPNGK